MAIRIRMYRVGFGDCFLVTFGDRHVLIDCGVFKGTSGTGDIGTIDAAIDDIVKETSGKLALIVMTHRHADHIAGFGRAVEKFEKMKVEDVWMPVWEAEYDSRAVAFQAGLTSIAVDLQDHLDAALGAGEVDTEVYHRVGNVTGREPFGVAGRSNNKIALDLLKHGLGVEPKYLGAGDTPPLPKSLRTIGLGVRVLGPPPISDIDLMKLMDLKKGVGQYLAMRAAEQSCSDGGSIPWQPFSPAWYDEPSSLRDEAFTEWMPNHGRDGFDESTARNARDRLKEMLSAAPDGQQLEVAASKLDDFLNNQSLVLLFTYEGRNLLFAGDAQGGNWEHWLFETDEPNKSPTGPLARSAREILGSIDMYKVGHHGSTNATPKIVAQQLREGAIAMCSTEANVYGASEETAVPLVELMTALGKNRTLVRSDGLAVEVDGAPVKTHSRLPAAKELRPGSLWVDCVLEGPPDRATKAPPK